MIHQLATSCNRNYRKEPGKGPDPELRTRWNCLALSSRCVSNGLMIPTHSEAPWNSLGLLYCCSCSYICTSHPFPDHGHCSCRRVSYPHTRSWPRETIVGSIFSWAPAVVLFGRAKSVAKFLCLWQVAPNDPVANQSESYSLFAECYPNDIP